jgi:hypothetical protein
MNRILCTIGTVFAAIAGALAIAALVGAIFFGVAALICLAVGFAEAAVVLGIIALCLLAGFVVAGLVALLVAALVGAGSCPGYDPYTGRVPAASGATAAGFTGLRGFKWPFRVPEPPPWLPPIPFPCGPAPFGFDWMRLLQCLSTASSPCGCGKEGAPPGGGPGAESDAIVWMIRWLQDRVNDEREARARAKRELESYREQVPEGPLRDAVDEKIEDARKAEQAAEQFIDVLTTTAGAAASTFLPH